MKKFVFSIVATLLFALPLAGSANTNALSTLLSRIQTASASQCADPVVDPSKAGDFCTCFVPLVTLGCINRLRYPQLCSTARIKGNIAQLGASTICAKYPTPGISASECEDDVNYYYAHC